MSRTGTPGPPSRRGRAASTAAASATSAVATSGVAARGALRFAVGLRGRAPNQARHALLNRPQEIPDRRVRLPRPLELRDMAALELDMPRPRKRALHVLPESDRHEPVVPAPDEERVRRELGQPAPEAVGAVRLVEIDVAGG